MRWGIGGHIFWDMRKGQAGRRVSITACTVAFSLSLSVRTSGAATSAGHPRVLPFSVVLILQASTHFNGFQCCGCVVCGLTYIYLCYCTNKI